MDKKRNGMSLNFRIMIQKVYNYTAFQGDKKAVQKLEMETISLHVLIV
jgi:hypothetical protein